MEWLIVLAKACGAIVVGLFGFTFLVVAATTEGQRLFFSLLGAGAMAGAWFSWPRMPNAWRRDQPTDKQLRYAADLGITVPPGATKGQVSDLISAVTGR